MEDSECKKDLMELRFWTDIQEFYWVRKVIDVQSNWILYEHDNQMFWIQYKHLEVIWNDLTINHILAYCKNKKYLAELSTSWILHIFQTDWEKRQAYIQIDLLKNFSEQQQSCKQILDFLNN